MRNVHCWWQDFIWSCSTHLFDPAPLFPRHLAPGDAAVRDLPLTCAQISSARPFDGRFIGDCHEWTSGGLTECADVPESNTRGKKPDVAVHSGGMHVHKRCFSTLNTHNKRPRLYKEYNYVKLIVCSRVEHTQSPDVFCYRSHSHYFQVVFVSWSSGGAPDVSAGNSSTTKLQCSVDVGWNQPRRSLPPKPIVLCIVWVVVFFFTLCSQNNYTFIQNWFGMVLEAGRAGVVVRGGGEKLGMIAHYGVISLSLEDLCAPPPRSDFLKSGFVTSLWIETHRLSMKTSHYHTFNPQDKQSKGLSAFCFLPTGRVCFILYVNDNVCWLLICHTCSYHGRVKPFRVEKITGFKKAPFSSLLQNPDLSNRCT